MYVAHKTSHRQNPSLPHMTLLGPCPTPTPHPRSHKAQGTRTIQDQKPFPSLWESACLREVGRKSQQAGSPRCHSGEILTAATSTKNATDNGYPCAWRAGSQKAPRSRAIHSHHRQSTEPFWLAPNVRKRRVLPRTSRLQIAATVASHGLCCDDELVEFVGTSDVGRRVC
jgi:hypothetical protein